MRTDRRSSFHSLGRGYGIPLDTLPVRYTAPTGYPTPLPPEGAWDQRYPVPWKGPGIRDTLHPPVDRQIPVKTLPSRNFVGRPK